MIQVGVDCEEVSRFRRLPFKKRDRFYRRIFTASEIKYCSSFRDPYPRFAARFAAKEAAIKALNSFAEPSYSDIEIQRDRHGKPTIRLKGDKLKPVRKRRFYITLSITHTKRFAVAFVIFTDSGDVRNKSEYFLRESSRAIKNGSHRQAVR